MRPRWFTFGAAVLSGVLFALPFPPFEWVVLLPVALVPWLVALAREQSRRRALVSGFLFGMAYWCVSIPWIVYVVTHYGGQSPVMGVVCLLLLAGILAEWPAIVAWGTAAVARSGSPLRLAVFPLLWMATEHARSFIYKGFPWNLTANALYRHPIWMQSASVWGVYGLGFAVVAVGSLLASGVVFRRVSGVVGAAVAVLVLGAGGAFRLSGREGPAVRLEAAVLQPNLTEEDRVRDPVRAYATVIGQVREAATGTPGLIVIPESALPVTWNGSSLLRHDLTEISDRGIAIVFNDVEETSGGRYYNVARLLLPGGRQARPYRKVHLVPFGEYVPLPKIFFFARQISTGIGAFAAAERPTLLEMGETSRIGVGVCYEITYPSLARDEVAAGATLLATISNDSWYGRAGAQAQHFAGATLRAVENHRYLLRSAITGVSGVVDAKGRIRQELGENQAGILKETVWEFRDQTIWTRWGYWLPRIGDGLGVCVLVFGLLRWWRSRARRL